MRTLRRAIQRLLGFFTGESRDPDLATELQAHIEMQTADNIRSGMPPEEARRAATLKFGSVEATKESYRDQRSLPQLDMLRMDLRYAATSLSRRAGMVTIAVLSLALGIGATTTIFTWFQAVYLDPLPGVKDARHLVTISASYKERGGRSESYGHMVYIRDHCPLFDGLFAHEMQELALSDGKRSELEIGGIVSGNYFDVLGVEMALGRGFRPDEDEVLDRNPVIVLGYDVWQKRFGNDPNILGQQVELNRVPFTVIGVAPRGFGGVYGGIGQHFWFPVHMARALDPNHVDRLAKGSWLQIMGRPKPGVTVGQIQANMNVLAPQMRELFGQKDSGYFPTVYALHEAQRGFHSALFGVVAVLGVAAGIVLFLAWLNVANLLIAAATDRAREMAIRVSLGAGRARIVRQLLTENMVLALLGGVFGLLFTYWTHNAVAGMMGDRIELIFNTAMNFRVFAFCGIATVLSALFFGTLPALEAGRVNLTDSLKEGASATTASIRRSRLRSVLVIGQMGLSMAAVAGAILFTQYLLHMTNVQYGFRTDHLLIAETNTLAAGLDETRGQNLLHFVADRLRALPDVESAAWTSFQPMSGSGGSNSRSLKVAGYDAPEKDSFSVTTDYISPAYLETIGIPLLKGREFTWADDAKAPLVAIVNEQFVNEYMKGREPIGFIIEVGGKPRTIVGVNRNYVYRHPQQSGEPDVFLPLAQEFYTKPILMVHTRGNPLNLAPDTRKIIEDFDSHLPVSQFSTMDENIRGRFADTRFIVAILLIFGTFTSVLAAIGLHGTLTAFFNQRRRELGIRAALGATPRNLRDLVILRSTRLTAIGIALGLLLSFGFARSLNGVMYNFPPLNIMAAVLAAAGAALIAAISSYAPLRGVSRTDPMIILRYE